MKKKPYNPNACIAEPKNLDNQDCRNCWDSSDRLWRARFGESRLVCANEHRPNRERPVFNNPVQAVIKASKKVV